jgi:hypothetical protein
MDQAQPTEADRSSVKKFHAFYGTGRFITVFTTAHHYPELG